MSGAGSEVTAAGSSAPFERARQSRGRRLFPAIRADMAAFAMELQPAGEPARGVPSPQHAGPGRAGPRCPAGPVPPAAGRCGCAESATRGGFAPRAAGQSCVKSLCNREKRELVACKAAFDLGNACGCVQGGSRGDGAALLSVLPSERGALNMNQTQGVLSQHEENSFTLGGCGVSFLKPFLTNLERFFLCTCSG